MHDVTVSVWNRFHSTPLIEGLVTSGFDVLGLGTTRRMALCTKRLTCWSAGLLTQASFKSPVWRDKMVLQAMEMYQRFAAKHVSESRCIWGWNGHHLAAFLKAKRLGIPIVLEVGSTHIEWGRAALSEEYARHGREWEDGMIRKLRSRVLAEYEIADFICVPNNFVAHTFEANGIAKEKLVVNPYGMEFEFWSQHSSSADKNENFVVIYAGQFMLRKGVAYLMEAWRELDLKTSEMWVVGGIMEDAKSYLQNLPRNVKILGGKSAMELRDLFQKADVFILPSLEEGMARAALEAMASGIPVIVTEETGVGDAVRDGLEGWVIPSKNSHAIADALRVAASDRNATRLKGNAARERAADYTWNAYGKRAAKFLEKVLTKTTRSPESDAGIAS